MISSARSLLAQKDWMRLRLRLAAEEAAVVAGRALTRAGTALLLYPHRREHIDLPTPVGLDGGRVDIVEDLVEYTGLARDEVEALIRRRLESFRTEWHAVPPAVRTDEWFYLASRTYLFANAIHDAEDVADAVSAFLADGSHVLDFGGGTGNLALALAGREHRVDYVERSALQKDFVRFRVAKHGLEERVRVLDQWAALSPDRYDLVCAIDVFEHIESLGETLPSVLQALRPGGMLAESSPFVRSASNPMHHETEAEFLDLMQRNGFSPAHEHATFRLWRADAGQP